jgi:hypothetical protein
MKVSYSAMRALIVAAHVAAPFAGMQMAFSATATPTKPGPSMPAPSISKALDALILPLNRAVAKTFKIDKKEHGVLIVSVKPGGVADKQGIKAGDVISEFRGHKVRKPIDIDVGVRRDLAAGHSDFSFGVLRGGAVVAVAATITLESYNEAVAVTEISTWESVGSESSFSYSEYVSEETTTIEASYESEESVVEESMSHEESATDEESASDENAAEEDTADNSDDSDDGGSDDSSDGDSGGDD